MDCVEFTKAGREQTASKIPLVPWSPDPALEAGVGPATIEIGGLRTGLSTYVTTVLVARSASLDQLGISAAVIARALFPEALTHGRVSRSS